MQPTTTRRVFLGLCGSAALAALPLSASADAAKLDVADPTAKALGYVENVSSLKAADATAAGVIIRRAFMDSHMSAPSSPRAAPWNKGKLVGQKAPFKLKDIWALRVRLQMEGRVRELALLNLGIDSKLRGCDLVGLKVGAHVLDTHHAAFPDKALHHGPREVDGHGKSDALVAAAALAHSLAQLQVKRRRRT